MFRYLISGVLTLSAAVALASDRSPSSTEGRAFGARTGFGSHEENYVLLQNQMRNTGWAASDERALRAHFSLRYVLFARDGRREDTAQEFFLVYTGEFDFYAGTRPSGPVINRLSNPGAQWRWHPKRLFGHDTKSSNLTLSLEHASDGQTTEVTDGREEVRSKLVARAQRAYEQRDHAYFDTISRGSNFVGLRAALTREDFNAMPFDVSVKLRLYLKQDSDVTWGPLAASKVRLSDYHRLQVAGDWPSSMGTWSLKWTVGDKGRRTDSFDLGVLFPLIKEGHLDIPLYLHYHRGPLNTLSNYTQRQDSLGIGLKFASF